MESSGDDETGGKAPAPALEKAKASPRIVFGNIRFGRTKTSPTPPSSIYSSSPNPRTHPVFQDHPDGGARERGTLVRTRSDEVGLRCRDEWAAGILAQDALKESVIALRSSVAEYEKEASAQQWKDLLKIHADIRELGQLAESAQKKKGALEVDESADGLSKFTSVAFEYSKLLDVVMNQSPEYALLAWGAIKFLLVAHVNHSKLKHSVQHYLIEFGRQFGVVNQLMTCLPTGKMLEAVAEAYAAFSKFLAKAVKYYCESKIVSAIKAFGFPWETRFQVLVNQIEHAFKRIKELANAGHYGMAIQNQNLLRTISHNQSELRLEVHQDSVNLRKLLKDELKDEVKLLFDSFNRNWIQRFEQIMQSAIPAIAAASSNTPALPPAQVTSTSVLTSPSSEIPNRRNRSATPVGVVEYADSIVTQRTSIDAAAALEHATFLADYINDPKRLRRFRDKSFPLLHYTDNDDARLRVRLRHITPMDLQQCMGLLRHESVKAWIETNHSSLLWVNTQKTSGVADWASSFATTIIGYAGKIEYLTVLCHFCGNHRPADQVSTASVTVQSMIMQILQVHHKKFVARKAFPFTREHFEDATHDIAELWSLFVACLQEAEIRCAWLILDNIDNLQKGTDWDFLIAALQGLSEEDSRLFKVFVTARGTRKESTSGIQKVLASISQGNRESSRVVFVNVPRTISRVSQNIYQKSKRPARLPDDHSGEDAPKADVGDLLDTDSDEPWEDKEEVRPGYGLVESPISIKPGKRDGIGDEDDDLGLSDSSLEFMKDDPFASSEESGWEREEDRVNGMDKDFEDIYLQDSDNDFLLGVTKKPKDEFDMLSSSDDEKRESSSKKPQKVANGKSRTPPQGGRSGGSS